MYRCSRCGAEMSLPLDKCPKCGVLLSGVKCQTCGYTGGKAEFIRNNNRCPKCGSNVRVPVAPDRAASRPAAATRRLAMLAAAAVVGTLGSLILYRQLAPWATLNTALVGLAIHEVLYRTRKWLNPRTLGLYIAGALLVTPWLAALLMGIEFGQFDYFLSLDPFTTTYSTANFLHSLYYALQTALLTGIAYWLVRSTQKNT